MATINPEDPTAVAAPKPSNEATSSATSPILIPANGPGRVRGTGILNSLHFAHHAYGGRSAVEKVTRCLTPADHLQIEGLRRKAWYPFALHCRVLRACDAGLGNGDLTLLHDLGYHSASCDFPAFFRPIMRRGRAGWILEVATKLWRLFHGEGSWVIERSPQELIARLHDYPEADEAFCVSFIGYITAALELSGATEVEGSHPACKARGAPQCVYTLRWS